MITYQRIGSNGRLGNQMFQYAAARGLAHHYKTSCVFPDFSVREWHGQTCVFYKLFNLPDPNDSTIKIIKDFPYISIEAEYKTHPYKQPDPNFYSAFSDFFSTTKKEENQKEESKKLFNLEGFPESEYFFKDIKQTIVSDFRLRPEVEEEASAYLMDLKIETGATEVVALHMRRGDAYAADHYNVFDHPWLVSFFENCFSLFSLDHAPAGKIENNENSEKDHKKYCFLVFTGGSREEGNGNSADIAWCKDFFGKHFPLLKFHYSEGGDTVKDFSRFVCCDHAILNSSSTLSWWAAYLIKNAQKIVAAPAHPPNDSRMEPEKYWPEGFTLVESSYNPLSKEEEEKEKARKNSFAYNFEQLVAHRKEDRWPEAWVYAKKLLEPEKHFTPEDIQQNAAAMAYDRHHYISVVAWYLGEIAIGERAARAAFRQRGYAIDKANLDIFKAARRARTNTQRASYIDAAASLVASGQGPSITVILNVFKRPYTLKEQLLAVMGQTRPPQDVWVWVNGPEHFAVVEEIIKSLEVQDLAEDLDIEIQTFKSSANLGVWPRFVLGLNATTEFVCVFDDDTIPGPRWFENCLETEKTHKGVLGTIGVVADPRRTCTLTTFKRFGWDENNNTEPVAVDWLGHSWFFRAETLPLLFLKPPPKYLTFIAGEDMHFAAACQAQNMHSQKMRKLEEKKRGGKLLQMWVPPHPPGDTSLWGSLPNTAWKYGTDANAITASGGANQKFSRVFQHLRQHGFRCLLDQATPWVELDSVVHLQYFKEKIRHNRYFALIRPNDGEWFILNNQPIVTQDRWAYEADPGDGSSKENKLRVDLFDAVSKASSVESPNIHVGIPCPGCYSHIYGYYTSTFPGLLSGSTAIGAQFDREREDEKRKLTYGNMFCNKNWQDWTLFLRQWCSKQFNAPVSKKIVYIGSGGDNASVQKAFGCAETGESIIKKCIKVDELLVNKYNDIGRDFVEQTLREMAELGSDNMFLISAGPITKILAVRGHLQNPNNWYLDVGSTVDIFFKESTNRGFVNANDPYSSTICSFVFGHS